MEWVVIILLGILAVFIANFIYVFSISPILCILFVIFVIAGMVIFFRENNRFEFGSLMLGSWLSSLVLSILLCIAAWDSVLVPVINKSLPFLDPESIEAIRSDLATRVVSSIIIVLAEPICIGILFSFTFEAIVDFIDGIVEFINAIREEMFVSRYIDRCYKKVLEAEKPIGSKSIIGELPCGDVKYKFGDSLLEELKSRTFYDSKKRLYWGEKEFNKMKQQLEKTLLNTTPRTLDWIVANTPPYKDAVYTAFRRTAIEDLVKEKVFIVEATTGANMQSGGKGETIYRHRAGQKLKTTLIDADNDPDFA